MGNRSARFISVLFASVMAGVPLSAMSQTVPTAPEPATSNDCLASPGKTVPQGQHWYYRIERGTKRQCWYLREEGAKTAQTATTAPGTDAPAPSSVQDARAEWTTAQAAPVQTTPLQNTPASNPPQAATPAATGNAQQPALDTRWPDTANVAPAPAPQAAPAAKPADKTADVAADKVADPRPAPKPAASPAPASVAAAATPNDRPNDKPTGSLQTLLLVIGAALALAGITGSVIYRFAGSRIRIQAHDGARRRINWEQPADSSRAPWAEAAARQTPPVRRPQPVDVPLAPTAMGKPAPASRSALERLAADIKRVETAPAKRDETTTAFDGETDVARIDLDGDPAEAETNADIDVEALTRILERLALEGPKLSPSTDEHPDERSDQPIAAAGPADFARSRQARSGVRA